MGQAVCISSTRSLLGEGPLWVAEERAVYWVDIRGQRLHRRSFDDAAERHWEMPEPICWIARRRSAPGFLAGFARRFALLQLDPLLIESLGEPEPERPGNRMNDAGIDAAGRAWAGTMDDRELRPTGALYRIDADGRWSVRDTGYMVSNGPTFSPAHDMLYHTDSTRGLVYRFALHADGSLGERRVFANFAALPGAPDGMATDIEGGIWIAHYGGGRVSRFLPNGRCERSIELPVSQITSCCFAGERFDRLVITTAAVGREGEPLAGCLFEADPGVCGAPVFAWAG